MREFTSLICFHVSARVRDHYENTISQTTVLTDRISRYDYFSSLEDLQQEMQLVAGSRPDFKQIDAYENSPTGPQLIATTASGAPALASINDGDRTAMELPRSGVSSSEITRNKNDYWLVTSAINSPQHSGFIQALVLKGSRHELVDRLHREYNLVLFGAVAAVVALLYLLFIYFFRRPVKEILQAMAQTRGGEVSVRAPVRRDDELGAVASGFNQLMDNIEERCHEREVLLNQISELNAGLQKQVSIQSRIPVP